MFFPQDETPSDVTEPATPPAVETTVATPNDQGNPSPAAEGPSPTDTPVDAVTVEPTNPPPVAETEIAAPSPTMEEVASAAPAVSEESTPEAPPTEEPTLAPTETPVPTFTPTATPILPVANNDVQEGEEVPLASESGNAGVAEEGVATSAPLTDVILQMKEKLQEDLPPEDPLYEITGRGLVYNCVGQHWACVDREVYFKCQEVAQWAKDHQQAIRCVPANVYISTEDCTTMQLYNINKLIRPEECPRP